MSESSEAPTTGEESDSSFTILIFTVCAVGITAFIAFHVALLIVIILYIRKRNREGSQGKITVIYRNGLPVDKSQVDDELVANESQANKNVVVDGHQAVVMLDDHVLGTNGYESLKKIPYPTSRRSTVVKDRPKLTCNDYEVVKEVNDYQEALYTYANIPDIPDYVNVSESEDPPIKNNATDDEDLYIDPGHCPVALRKCFENKKHWIINKNDISILQKLGSGEFGTVHLGLWSNGSADPAQVAVKTLNSQCSESDRVKFLREAAIMGQFEDCYIIRLFGVVLQNDNIMIVLEYMSQGDLREYLIDLKNKTSLDDLNNFNHDLLSFCRNVSAGLSHLSRKCFVHRDLAARNILVSSDNVCKIADFGMARDVGDDTYYKVSGGKIPVKWTAPEAIFYKKYSVKSDVWSFGCVLYEIWSLGHKPFEDDDARVYLRKISDGYRLPPPPGCPRAIYELMIKCWHPVANERITSCGVFSALQKSDSTLLPKNNEEQSTKLGGSLSTSDQLYLDLQKTYTVTQ